MNTGKYILDGHKPIPVNDAMIWARWFETADKRVAKTLLPEGIKVSTIFWGLDHNHSGEGPPLIFETMVFGGKFDKEMERYSSWEEAEEGHKQMVSKVKAEVI